MANASISVELNDDHSEVILSGSYDSVITAICAGIKGLIVNMCKHPKYIEIMQNSEMNEAEFEEELIYNVMLNIMDRIEEHSVISMEKTNKDVNTSTDVDIAETNSANINGIDINCDEFEAFLNNMSSKDSADGEKD